MSTFIVMKTTLREEANIPILAIDAFKDAFKHAIDSSAKVTYVQNQQLVEKLNGHIQILDDLADAYVIPELKRSVLKRKKKQEVVA